MVAFTYNPSMGGTGRLLLLFIFEADPVWSETRHVNQAGLEYRNLIASPGIKGVHYHTWLKVIGTFIEFEASIDYMRDTHIERGSSCCMS